MNTKSPKVFVGIVTFNNSVDIRACLNSVLGQSYKPLHIVILDNASSDNTVSLIKKFYPQIHIITSKKNVGFGNGHNTILTSISPRRHDFYFALNPDIILNRKYVSELITMLNKSQADWGVGKLYAMESKTKKTLYSVGHGMLKDGYAFNIGYKQRDTGQYNQQREIFGAPAAAVIWKISAIQRLSSHGAFYDPSMFMYYEDTDTDWRARNMGMHCYYSPLSTALHRGSNPSRKLAIQSIRNRYTSVIKNAHTLDYYLFNLPMIFCHCFLRIAVTPLEGMWLFKQLLFQILYVRQYYRTPTISRGELLAWFIWSEKERTGQPKTIRSRFSALLTRQKGY